MKLVLALAVLMISMNANANCIAQFEAKVQSVELVNNECLVKVVFDYKSYFSGSSDKSGVCSLTSEQVEYMGFYYTADKGICKTYAGSMISGELAVKNNRIIKD